MGRARDKRMWACYPDSRLIVAKGVRPLYGDNREKRTLRTTAAMLITLFKRCVSKASETVQGVRILLPRLFLFSVFEWGIWAKCICIQKGVCL